MNSEDKNKNKVLIILILVPQNYVRWDFSLMIEDIAKTDTNHWFQVI